MLIISDEEAVGVGGEGSLARTRQTEEKSDILILLADISRRVEGELPEFDGLEVVLGKK